MSRIGKKPVRCPPASPPTVESGTLTVKGPKGSSRCSCSTTS